MMPTRRRVVSRRVLLAAAVGAPVLTACSGGTKPSEPRLKVQKAWSRTVYTGEDQDRIRALAFRLRVQGDTLLRADGTGTDGARVTALDVAGGDVRWTLRSGTPLTAPDVGAVRICVLGPRAREGKVVHEPVLKATHGVLPVSYVSDDRPRTTGGVLGVDLAKGTPRWAFAAVPDPTSRRAVVTGVSDAVVLVTVARHVGPLWEDSAGPVTTIAVDPATGRRLWSRPGLVGLAADADAVVAAGPDDGLPCVLDARTGRLRWRGREPLAGPYEHIATAAGYTVFRPGTRTPQVVRLSTGQPLEFTADAVPRPVACDPPLLVWDSRSNPYAPGPNGFASQVLPDGDVEAGRARPGGYEFTPAAGTGGPYIWGDYTTINGGIFEPDPTQPTGTVAVDRTGGPCSPSLRGLLADVTDRWLVLTVSDPVQDNIWRTGFEVHRLST